MLFSISICFEKGEFDKANADFTKSWELLNR